MKRIILFFISFLSLLSCGPIYNPSAFERLTMEDAYYYTYIYPNNPDIERVNYDYYMFLLRETHKGNHFYLAAWEKYENVKNWTLSISNADFLFSCEIRLLVYKFEDSSFLSIEESVEKEIFSLKILENSFKKLPEYISVTYY